MPLWDSVQRSLEKASQEAARLAKTQRLRSTIDGLSRQINTQQNNLLAKTMELFADGHITQSDLLMICQELVNLQQQFNQAQMELKQLQMSQGPASQGGAPAQYPAHDTGTTMPYLPASGELPSTTYAPPPPEYQSYMGNTSETPLPPPPPGAEPLTVSAMETMNMSGNLPPPAPPADKRLCPFCQAELFPNHAFCHNCGAPVQDSSETYLPTMRAGIAEQTYPGGQETIRADTSPPGRGAALPESYLSSQEAKQDKEV